MNSKYPPHAQANPEVLEEFSVKLGLSGGVMFSDVYGLDEEMLGMVPRPVYAVLMLFPVTEKTETMQLGIVAENTNDVFYLKQTVGNACGTIGLLHALLNNRDVAQITPGSFLDRYFAAVKDLTPEDRGRFLESPPEGAPDVEDAHKEASLQGQSKPPSEEEDVNLHFVCFVRTLQGRLVELDGRRAGVIDHGPCEEGRVLETSVEVVKKFVEMTESISFNLIAVCKPEEEEEDAGAGTS